MKMDTYSKMKNGDSSNFWWWERECWFLGKPPKKIEIELIWRGPANEGFFKLLKIFNMWKVNTSKIFFPRVPNLLFEILLMK